jgi:sialic acid synthase SpsE
MIVSTGMSTISEIRDAARLIEANGAGKRTTFLHCVSEYPCPEQNAGISFIETLRSELEQPIGYSDHTEGCGAAAAAVALGATVIEKTITHNRADEGFDHHYAIEEPEFTSYVRTIREAAEALTPKPEKLTEAERATALRARRGVYARRDVALGDVLSESDLLVVRPPTAVRPNEAEALIGRRTKVSLRAFEPLSFDQFEK